MEVCAVIAGMSRRSRSSAAATAIASIAVSVLLSGCGDLSLPTSETHSLKTWSSVSIYRISCPTEGRCVAIGDRQRGDKDQLVFVKQQGAVWSVPISGPWLGANDAAGNARISCSSPDNCVTASATDILAAISPRQVGWGRTDHLPFTDKDGRSRLQSSLACSPRGLCWAIVEHEVRGSDPPRTLRTLTYAIGEQNGQWLRPFLLGPKSLTDGRRPVIGSAVITCWSLSSCTVGGFGASLTTREIFVQTEVNGRWGLPSVAPASFYTTSPERMTCTSTGTCLLVGTVGPKQLSAVEQESNGHWQRPVLNLGPGVPYVDSYLSAVACNSTALCFVAGESYRTQDSGGVPFVQVEVRGHWRRPVLIREPGRGALYVAGAECPTASSCVFAGEFDTFSTSRSFVATYAASVWHYLPAVVDGVRNDVFLLGMSCSRSSCWVSGTVGPSKKIPTGVVYQLPALT
jgi:hypothetical protein